MSDPVTNFEIEDVLSSIRRLVSEDPQELRARKEKAVERFILTPALRVADQPEGQEDTGDDVLVLKIPNDAEDNDDAEDSDSLAEFSEELPILTVQDNPDLTDDREIEAETGAFVDEPTDPDVIQMQDPDPVENRFDELEDAVNQTGEEWEPDGSEPEADEVPIHHIFATVRELRDGNETRNAEEGTNLETEIQFEARDEPVMPAFLEDTQIDPEISDHKVEPLFKHEDVFATGVDAEVESPTLREDREVSVFLTKTSEEQAPDDQHLQPVADEIPDEGLLTDEQVIDEDALRDLVAAMVREELQGSMGERITRNVRRMVRREIQRAMALKDFD